MSENNAAFDKDEQAILSQIVPDGETVTEAETSLPVETAAAPAPAPEATATAPAPGPAETPAPETTTAEPAPAPQGDTRAALRASRRAEKRLRDELERLQQENEALKQGKVPVNTSVSDAELAELEADFPIQAKAVRRMRELEQELAQARAPAQAQREFEPPSYDPGIQEVIDSVPDLVAWQYDPAAQDKFKRAIEYDKALAVDPDWRDRDVAERFAEAARRTQAALAPTPSAAPAAAPRTDPASVIAAAPVSGPKGISDFRGGASANAPSVNFSGMTDEQIMASLPVS